jgi:hypothetical protein
MYLFVLRADEFVDVSSTVSAGVCSDLSKQNIKKQVRKGFYNIAKTKKK